MKTKKDTNANVRCPGVRIDVLWCLWYLVQFDAGVVSVFLLYRTAAGLSRLVPDSLSVPMQQEIDAVRRKRDPSCSEWNDAKMTAGWRRRSFRAHTGNPPYRSAPLQGANLVLTKQQRESCSLSLCRYGFIQQYFRRTVSDMLPFLHGLLLW